MLFGPDLQERDHILLVELKHLNEKLQESVDQVPDHTIVTVLWLCCNIML